MKKKLLSVILSVFMIFSTFTINVFAESEPKAVDTTFMVNGLQYKVTSIGNPNTVEVAKNWYYSNETLNIPETIADENGVSYAVTRIGYQAFLYNDNFTSVTLPSTITSIGQEAFECCDGFTEITIPDSVKTLETAAFQQCSNLATVNISSTSNLETIGDRVFYSTKISNIYIPASVKNIGSLPFRGLSLSSITFNSTTPPTLTYPLTSGSFYECGITTIYVPAESIGAYRLALKEDGSYYYFENKVQKIPSDSYVAISDLLPEDFPDRNYLLHWQNSNEVNLSIDEYGFLWFDKDELNDRPFVTCSNLMASPIAEGNYSYSDVARNSSDSFTFTFAMDEGKLTNITVEGFDDDYVIFNGSYQMQDYPTVEELLNKAENAFPTSVDDAWADEYYFEGLFVYISDGYLKLYDSLNDTTTDLVSVSEKVSIDNNYFMVSTSNNKDLYFYIYEDELYELGFYDDYVSGPFVYPPSETTTLGALFEGLTTAFPTSLDSAFTDYSNYFAYIDNDELVVSDGNETIDSIALSKIVPSTSYISFITKSGGCFYIDLNDELDTIQYVEYYCNEPYIDSYMYPYSELVVLLYTNFPSGYLPWLNENGKAFYIDGSYLTFADFDNEIYDSAYDNAYEIVLTSGTNQYTATTTGYELENPLTLTFNVDDNDKLLSLTVEGYTGGEFDFFDGTYYPPFTVNSIIDVDFPIYDDYSPSSAWQNEAGTILYGIDYGEGSVYFCFENDDYLVEGYTPFTYIELTEDTPNVYTAVDGMWEYNNEIEGYADITCNTNDDGKLIGVTVEFSSEFAAGASVLDGTYTKVVTVADILPDDFPVYVDALPENSWANENGKYLYIVNPYLVFDESGPSISKSTILTKNNDNYTYTDGDNNKFDFTMSNGNLTGITVSNFSSDQDINGTYTAPIIKRKLILGSNAVYISYNYTYGLIDANGETIVGTDVELQATPYFYSSICQLNYYTFEGISEDDVTYDGTTVKFVMPNNDVSIMAYAAKPISSVDLTLTLPEEGDIGFTLPTIDSTLDYELNSGNPLEVIDSNGDYVDLENDAFVAGEEYMTIIHLKAKSGRCFNYSGTIGKELAAERNKYNVTTKVNDETITSYESGFDFDCNGYLGDSSLKHEYLSVYYKFIIPVEYEMIDGAESTIDLADNKDAAFRSNAAYDDFVKVLVDDEEIANIESLDNDKCKVSEGSTVVTLKANYLSSLEKGEHTITIVSSDGQASTTFTITRSEPDTPYVVPNTGVTSNNSLLKLTSLSFMAICTYMALKKKKED